LRDPVDELFCLLLLFIAYVVAHDKGKTLPERRVDQGGLLRRLLVSGSFLLTAHRDNFSLRRRLLGGPRGKDLRRANGFNEFIGDGAKGPLPFLSELSHA
jgi:hypothetical protein